MALGGWSDIGFGEPEDALVVDDVPPRAATRGFVLPQVAVFAVATAWFTLRRRGARARHPDRVPVRVPFHAGVT
jgi:hypothetical protein